MLRNRPKEKPGIIRRVLRLPKRYIVAYIGGFLSFQYMKYSDEYRLFVYQNAPIVAKGFYFANTVITGGLTKITLEGDLKNWESTGRLIPIDITIPESESNEINSGN